MKKLILLITMLVLTSGANASEYVSAKVRDISDRKYENAVIEVIDNAKSSIYVSVFVVSAEVDRVKKLLEGIERAIGRGVKVEFWVNTNRVSGDRYILANGILRLKHLGAEVYEVKPGYCLHDN